MVGCEPEARQNTVSPSIIECSGRIARAMPSWATAATLLAWALVSAASVSTTPIVVASDG